MYTLLSDKQNEVFEYIYEKICHWRLQKSYTNPNFRATYLKNGTMYILASHADGTMDTQMSQDSFGLEHHDRGNLVAVLQQPFTSQEKLRKHQEKKEVAETIETTEEDELTTNGDSNDDFEEKQVDDSVHRSQNSDGSVNTSPAQQRLKSPIKTVNEMSTSRKYPTKTEGKAEINLIP